MDQASNGHPSQAAMLTEIEGLAEQIEIDTAMIEALEAEGVVDRAKIENLEHALTTARRIGAAMGILMERLKITDDEAFAMLTETSMHRGVKLRDIADRLLFTGTLDD